MKLLTTVLWAASLSAIAKATSEQVVGKPHHLYMKRLRGQLSESQLVLPLPASSNDSMQGQLVSTSLEALNNDSDINPIIGLGTTFTMNFSIPKQSIEGDFRPQVELWLFPDKSQVPANTVMELIFHLTAFVFKPRSKPSTRGDTVIVFWNTSQDCMHLNLTRLGSRLSRPLQKRTANESTVIINGTLVYLAENADTAAAKGAAAYSDICTSLSPRTSSRPFLIIKNYCEHEFVPCSQHSMQRREISGVDQTGDEMAPAPEETIMAGGGDSACKLVPLIVNLAEVYGEFIMAPREIDVKDCSGKCNNGLTFSKHTEVKRRLRLLPGGESLPYFEPSCVPSKFKPMYMAIKLKDDSDIIVQMPDLLVEGCQCR